MTADPAGRRRIGVLGSGQLGRMFAIAARRMGYRVHTLLARRGHADRAGGRRRGHRAPTRTSTRSRAFARSVDVVTFEFENVPAAAAARARAARAGAAERAASLHITQHRVREKEVPRRLAAFRSRPSPLSRSPTNCTDARRAHRLPGGRQDRRLRLRRQGPGAVDDADGRRAHLGRDRTAGSRARERSSTSQRDLGRSRRAALDGAVVALRPVENRHARPHPRRDDRAGARAARASRRERGEITRAHPRELDVRRRAVRRVLRHADGELLVNELAPRPHNSGHLTFDAVRHQPVRAAGARGVRAAARIDRAAAPGGDGEPARRSVGDGEPDWAARAWRCRT